MGDKAAGTFLGSLFHFCSFVDPKFLKAFLNICVHKLKSVLVDLQTVIEFIQKRGSTGMDRYCPFPFFDGWKEAVHSARKVLNRNMSDHFVRHISRVLHKKK